MLTDLAISSLTDVVLACGLFFAAGLSFRDDVEYRSPAWYWAITLWMIGFATMLGAVDHGFYESIGHPAHRPLAVAARMSVTFASFVMLLATVGHFLGPRLRLPVLGLGALTAAATILVVLTSDDFLSVMVCYSSMLLLHLVLTVRGLGSGAGSVAMIAAILIIFTASGLAMAGFEGAFGLGVFGTYHVIMMPSVLFLYLGGRTLRRTAAAPFPNR